MPWGSVPFRRSSVCKTEAQRLVVIAAHHDFLQTVLLGDQAQVPFKLNYQGRSGVI
jgi:hypothetical protein